MYISSVAQPVSQPDALRLLLDRIFAGADVTLISEGDEGRVLLDLAADHLAERRSRILWAAEVLPGTLGLSVPLPHMAGLSKAHIPDDKLLAHGYQALTVLDQTCDRIVLLVSDAQALQHLALRYIQFVSRSGAPLQFVFCGTRKFLDLLNLKEFERLRARLTTGLVATLATPIAEASDMSPSLPSAAGHPVAWIEETAVPFSRTRRPAVSTSKPSGILPLGALALLGLSGAACLLLSMQSGEADGLGASSQAVAVIQPSSLPEQPSIPVLAVQVLEGDASRFDSKVSSAAAGVPDQDLPITASEVQGADQRSPSIVPPIPSATALDAAVTVWSQTSAVPEAEPNKPRLREPLPGPVRSLGRQTALAVPSHTAGATLGDRARRPKAARDQSALLPSGSDHWLVPQAASSSREPPDGRSPRYIGSYATDANGVRVFRLEP